MKKVIIALLVLTMGFAVMGTGCSDKKDDNSSSNTSNSSSTVSNGDSSSSDLSSDSNSDSNLDSDFKWEEGKYIVGLSDQGKKKKSITIPENCQSIMITNSESAKSYLHSKDNNGFNNNELVESIAFDSETVTSLPKFMFQDDTNLSEIKLPKNLKKIDECIFASCKALKTVEIPSTVKKIKATAFSYSGVEEITIPEGVEEVEDSIFDCTQLKKIYLPESLTTISELFLAGIDNMDSNLKTTYNVEVYVKKGSYADKHYDDYGESSFIKKYY